MKSRSRNRVNIKAQPSAPELRIGVVDGKVAFQAPQSGFSLVLEQAEIKGLLFCEATKKLEVSLHHGSTVSLKCDLENAKFWAVRLLSEERDAEFMYQPVVGERCRAWDDLR
ncbi:hypothetical protein Q3O97_19035 [Ralstonia pseudosolanacearum]|uniref:hypothetical protein n=1 Tax=Ralstonia pseudosolanacearum TaxID=1310165 RepID=UPI002701C2A9|nr:hypothetical protein [Ralstonia pseudosolanacearum]MDO3617944.1 hypothetical protein [Ralstonia pseudosolanacearum]